MQKAAVVDRFFMSTVGLFSVLFLTLILMPTMQVMLDAIDGLHELWEIVKNPTCLFPEDAEDDEDEDDYAL